MNLPNKLTVFRIILIPLFMIFILIPANWIWLDVAAAVIFIIAALTDTADGMIARKYGLVTNFGKFLDPLADKCMVFSAFISIIASSRFSDLRLVLAIAAVIALFRELAITSIRLVATQSDGKVIAASNLGKIKTVTQSVCIVYILLERAVIPDSFGAFKSMHIMSYALIVIMLFFTILSGYSYIKKYFRYIDPTK